MFNQTKTESYYLENITQRHNENPRKFLKLTDTEVQNIKVGERVKLIFLLYAPVNNGCAGEPMWVQITEINGVNFKGTLMGNLTYINDLSVGDEVGFTKHNIVKLINNAGFDIDSNAFITKRALENREINWLLQHSPLNEKDSGWQLFYGDEDEDYVEDSTNAVIISLAEVLSFEPHLARVFASNHNAFEWSDAKNDYVEVLDFYFE